MKQKRILMLFLALAMIFGTIGTSIPVFAVDYVGSGNYTVFIYNIGVDDELIFTYSQDGESDEHLYTKPAGVQKDEIVLVNVKQGTIVVDRYRNEEYPRVQMGVITVSNDKIGQPQQIWIEEADIPYSLTVSISGESGIEYPEPEISIGDYTVKIESDGMLAFQQIVSATLGNIEFDADGVAEYIGVGEGEHEWTVIMGGMPSGNGIIIINDSYVGVTQTAEIPYMGDIYITVNKLESGENPSTPEEGVKVLVNNEEVSFPDAQPKLISSKLYNPIRFIYEELGADVYWDADNYQALIDMGDIRITMKPNDNTMLVNGKPYALTSTPFIENSRIFLPAEELVQALNDVWYESEVVDNLFIAKYTLSSTQPEGYTGLAKLSDIPERTDYSTDGLILIDSIYTEESIFQGESGSGSGGSYENSTRLIGTSLPVILEYEVPLIIELNINPNEVYELAFQAPLLNVGNNSNFPLSIYIETFEPRTDSPHKFNDVLPTFFENWKTLKSNDSSNYLALGIKANDSSEWRVLDNEDTIYAKTVQDSISPILIGEIDPHTTVSLAFEASHGYSFKEVKEFAYDGVFVFGITD